MPEADPKAVIRKNYDVVLLTANVGRETNVTAA